MVDEMPYSVTLEVTRKCNLNCVFCGTKDNNSPVLNIKDVNNFLSDINRPLFIFITGGEPLIAPYVSNIRKHLKSDNIKQVGINTNGTLITKGKATDLVKNYNLIEVSIDGFEEIHDLLRGRKGTFRKAINGLKSLVNAKKRLKSTSIIGINTVITRMMIDKLEDFFDKMLSLGADVIQFTPMLYEPTSEVYQKYGLEPNDASKIKDIYDYLEKKGVLAPGMNRYYLNRMLEFTSGNYATLAYCGAGRYFVHISAEGTLYPCCSFYPRKHSSLSIKEGFNEDKITEYMHLLRQKHTPNSCKFCLNLYNTYLNNHLNGM